MVKIKYTIIIVRTMFQIKPTMPICHHQDKKHTLIGWVVGPCFGLNPFIHSCKKESIHSPRAGLVIDFMFDTMTSIVGGETSKITAIVYKA